MMPKLLHVVDERKSDSLANMATYNEEVLSKKVVPCCKLNINNE